jgi:O-antigen/teichoic acid export membrane protein
MTTSIRALLKGTVWTIGAYGVSVVLRVATSIILARLLAPELFGTMLIVYSLRTGIELISDVGIGQNIVYNKNADKPEFYNTAWSLQLIRSIVLWLAFLAAAFPVSWFYQSPVLVYVLPVTGLSIVFAGFTSVSRSLLQKRLEIARLVTFEILIGGIIGSAGHILFAYLTPTIWALAIGGLIGPAASMIASYFLLPGVTQRFYISRTYAWEILHFGKWIFLSSIVYFLSSNFDRLYLAKVIPLELLGVYGISRAISELLGLLVMRVGSNVLFPFIASHSQIPRDGLRRELAPIRERFLLPAVFGFSVFAATADLAVRLLYDERYQAAAWMLPVLIIGSWFSIVANINESTLLGLGRPIYGAVSNGAKFAFLLIGLPLGVHLYGPFGGVMAVALADLCRYLPILVGQKRERFSFARQDLFNTLAVFSLIGFWEWLRWEGGFGTSFDLLPVEVSTFLGSN